MRIFTGPDTEKRSIRRVTKPTDCATPRLFIVRHTPRILCQRDGEARLRHVEAYLLPSATMSATTACPLLACWRSLAQRN